MKKEYIKPICIIEVIVVNNAFALSGGPFGAQAGDNTADSNGTWSIWGK